MRVDCIDSHQALQSLKANWDTVYEGDPQAQFFLSWPWISEWLDGDRSQWFVLAAATDHSSSDYVAFFPIRLRTRMRRRGGGFYNEIGLAGRGLSDYTGFITLPQYEAEATAAFSHYLRHANWAVLNLEFLRTSPSRIEGLLRSLPMQSFCRTDVQTINKLDNIDNSICPFVSLPDDWEAYLAMLGTNTRQKIRRFLRKIETSGEFRITVANSETIERDIEILLKFWSIKWSARKGSRLPALVRANRTMITACFRHDALFLPVLWQADRPLAAHATFLDRPKATLLFFMAARDETLHGTLPPGFVLHAYSLRYAIESGFRIYDFLRGNEKYKYMFGVKEAVLRSLILTTRNLENLGGKLDPRCVLKVLSKTLQLHKSGRLREAERGYRQVLDTSPKSQAALYGYGQLLAKKGAHRGAARCFSKVVALEPDARNAWLRLGHSLEAAKRFADAAKTYRELIKLRPSDAKAYLQLGRTLLAQGRKKEASLMLKTAADLNGDPNAHGH